MHTDVSRADFHATAERLALVRLPVEVHREYDADKVGRLKKGIYGTRDAAINWACDLTEPSQAVGAHIGAEFKECVPSQKKDNIRDDAWQRLRGHRAKIQTR